MLKPVKASKEKKPPCNSFAAVKQGHQSYKALLSCVGTDSIIHGIPVESEGHIKAVGYYHFHLTTSSPDLYIVNHNQLIAVGILNSKPSSLFMK